METVQFTRMADGAKEEYALLRGLASPAGSAKLPSGVELKRESDWNSDADGGRSITSRLMQPAFMEYANGELDYLNEDDMDLDCGVVLNGTSLEAMGRRIFEEIVAVASGKQSKSELSGVGEEEFAPWMMGPVL